jgi:hypothetical protein
VDASARKLGLYEWSVLFCFLVIPVGLSVIDSVVLRSAESPADISLKWLTFSGIGLRLGSAGVKQIIQPLYTAKEIFQLKDESAAPIVRELGFANLSFAVLALLSLFFETFRVPAAIAGGSYFGLAGAAHVFRRHKGGEEVFAMVSDLFLFVALATLVVVTQLGH